LITISRFSSSALGFSSLGIMTLRMPLLT